MTQTTHTQTTPDFTPFIGWLSFNQIKTIKREACLELFRKWIEKRLLTTLSSKERFLEFTVWSTTFDQIEEFFADTID